MQMRPDGRRPLLRPCQVSTRILNEGGEGRNWAGDRYCCCPAQPTWQFQKKKNACCQRGYGASGRCNVSPSISPHGRTNRAWLGKVCVRDLPTALWAENPALMRSARLLTSPAFKQMQLMIKQRIFNKGHWLQRKTKHYRALVWMLI